MIFKNIIRKCKKRLDKRPLLVVKYDYLLQRSIFCAIKYVVQDLSTNMYSRFSVIYSEIAIEGGTGTEVPAKSKRSLK